MFKFSGFYRLSRDGFQHAGAMIFWRFRHREVRGEAFFHSIPNFLRRVAESLAASKQLGTGQHRKWIAAHNRSFSLWTLHTCTCLHVLYVYIYICTRLNCCSSNCAIWGAKEKLFGLHQATDHLPGSVFQLLPEIFHLRYASAVDSCNNKISRISTRVYVNEYVHIYIHTCIT